MTDAASKGAKSKAAPPPGKDQKATGAGEKVPAQKRLLSFFGDRGGPALDALDNEEVEAAHHQRQLMIVHTQAVVSLVLVMLLVLLAPFLQPVYHYYARSPTGNLITLDALTIPNMTNRAVVSWAVTSVTEIMTFGFGDIIEQVGKQRARFTDAGWKSFVTAFARQKIIESFKHNQVVLTSVPSDTAVIVNQGMDVSGSYQWKVEVPVIMTFATNNNVTQHKHSIVILTIERVSETVNPAGIAIKNWVLK